MIDVRFVGLLVKYVNAKQCILRADGSDCLVLETGGGGQITNNTIGRKRKFEQGEIEVEQVDMEDVVIDLDSWEDIVYNVDEEIVITDVKLGEIVADGMTKRYMTDGVEKFIPHYVID